MKIIGIDNPQETMKKINKKRLVIAIIVGIIALAIIIIGMLYVFNRGFRETFDKYVLMKNVSENNLVSIQIDESEKNYIYSYDKYIAILKNNTITHYNSSGKQEGDLSVEVINPIVDSNDSYLLIAEQNKQKIYLISEKNIVWQKELEGNISRVSVNKNGYVSVVLSGTTYKSVIQTFDPTGKEIFKTYLSNSVAMDTDISLDNKYLGFVEVSTNGTAIQSTVKIISIEKTKISPAESIVYTYNAPSNSLPISIKYQDSNKLVCMYDNSIHIIQNLEDSQIIDLSEKNKKFADIELKNYMCVITEKSSLLNTETTVEISSISGGNPNTYLIDSAVKQVYTYNEQLAVNLGSEVHFIGTNGWLLKKYISSQEVQKIVMCKDFSVIVYRNKLEIVNY